MSEPQRLQLSKSKKDAALDLTSLLVFTGMVYFVLNPDAYNRVTTAISTRFGALAHKLSVWQTKLSIRSLPETDDNS